MTSSPLLRAHRRASAALVSGLSIDYTSHLCHAFEHAPCDGAREQIAHALSTMGLSILNGGSSTLLGVSFMVFSVTPIFQTLFVILSHTVRTHAAAHSTTASGGAPRARAGPARAQRARRQRREGPGDLVRAARVRAQRIRIPPVPACVRRSQILVGLVVAVLVIPALLLLIDDAESLLRRACCSAERDADAARAAGRKPRPEELL